MSLRRESQNSLELLRDLIEERLGLYYDTPSLPILEDRLKTRIEALRLLTILDYSYFLKWDPRADIEWRELTSLLTVNETRFWRESDAIKLTADHLLGRLLQERQGPVKVWHAACSTGEEPYSLAIAAKRAGWKLGADLQILASDVDSKALRAAKEGIYGVRTLRDLPTDLRDKHLQQDGQQYHISADIREHVTFLNINLAQNTEYLWPKGCGVIFCRNMFIYLRDDTIERIARSMWDHLVPGGFLALGASDSLLRLDTPFEFYQEQGVILYRKVTTS